MDEQETHPTMRTMSRVWTHTNVLQQNLRVSNAVAPITAKFAISEGTHQRNVPCGAGITWQTTKVSNITIFSKDTIPTEPPPTQKA